jgi:YggT family protein
MENLSMAGQAKEERMFVAGNLLNALAQVLDVVLTLYMWVIIVSALISWVNPDPNNPIVRFLRAATNPLLSRIRRLLGFRMAIDVSPIIAILCIMFLKYFIVQSLYDLGRNLR